MTDELSDLGWAVELVKQAFLKNGMASDTYRCKLAVAALAGPLRRAARVEELEIEVKRRGDGWHESFRIAIGWQETAKAQEERIEDLEAALRAAVGRCGNYRLGANAEMTYCRQHVENKCSACQQAIGLLAGGSA